MWTAFPLVNKLENKHNVIKYSDRITKNIPIQGEDF